MTKNNIYHIHNLKAEIKDIKKELIDDCLKSIQNRVEGSHNYNGVTKYKDQLYCLFIESCKKYYKNLQVFYTPFKLWSYYTDENYHEGEVWHNHKNTCSLCGVLYLKTVKGCGIELRHKNKISYIEPKTYDLLIFPGFLDHKPLISKTKKRVSLQFEIFTQPE